MIGMSLRQTWGRLTVDRSARRGVTLVEMLVAMAISLLMMAAVANLFAVMTSSVSASRASIGLSEALRSTRNRLQADLSGATAPMLPPLRPENGDGYFEYFEGPFTDATAYNMGTTPSTQWNTGLYAVGNDTLTGDPDDVLMFTTRSKDGLPFVGKFWNGSTYSTVESQTAEVVWFLVGNGRTVPLTDANGNVLTSAGTSSTYPFAPIDQAQLYTLYRRVLLIAPEYSSTIGAYVGSAFFNYYDVSAHYDSANHVMVLNSMSDVTKRENRFGHAPVIAGNAPGNFPFGVYLPPAPQGSPPTLPAPGGGTQGIDPFLAVSGRVGEDVVLTNVLSFDVKAYDPSVPLYQAGGTSNTALLPSDVGYWNTVQGGTIVGYGGFVDLGYTYDYLLKSLHTNGGNISSVFSGGMMPMPGYGGPLGQYSSVNSYGALVNYPTYDTWSLHYEAPGPWNSYSNYSSTGVNNGINGFDDDGANGVDDPNEFQFPAPYPVPLRGIQVKIRTYEPDSKQIREVTIVQDFVPQ